jgi:leucine dehydrogenase
MSSIFETLQKEEHEEVVYGYDKHTGLKSIIAIHNTALGPAFGGTRMMDYKTEEEAIKDVLLLSKAMTYKNAIAGINFGGGKAIIIGNAKTQKNEGLLRSFGRLVESLSGRFIAGVDIGTDENDMVVVQQESNYITALPIYYGGAGSTSEATAYGVYQGIKAAVEEVFDNKQLEGKSIAIQGAGHIGYALAKYLSKDRVKIFISDVAKEALDKVKNTISDVEIVEPDQIYDLDVDIFSPCALGAILNDNTIPKLKCKLIAGSANNQLVDEEKHCRMIQDRGIVYVVDYILSAGGVINNSQQYNRNGYSKEAAYSQITKIGNSVKRILADASKNKILTIEVAKGLAESRIQEAISRKSWYLREESKYIKV